MGKTGLIAANISTKLTSRMITFKGLSTNLPSRVLLEESKPTMNK